MPARFLFPLCLIAVFPAFALGNDLIEPAAMWSGKVRDESLRKLAPQSGYIADAETWKKVWNAWQPGEELPQVDFSKDLILVGTVPGPNLVLMRPTINEGNVRYVVAGTRIGGPGFGYKLLQIRRQGVKSVNGNALNGKQPTAGESITVKVVGTLKSGIFAIGGETTGTTITAKGITWELDLGNNANLRKLAENLNGKTAIVQGSLERRKGVEIPERWIVTVADLKPAK